MRRLAKFTFGAGFNATPEQFNQPLNEMATGSENIMISGTGRTSLWLGNLEEGSLVGSKVVMNVGDDHGGLGSRTDSEGVGSIFRVLGAWFFIGAGSLFKNGVDTGADASTTLQIKTVTSGNLGTTYQAGLAQPSAPVIAAIAPPAGFTGKNNGVVSVKAARVRSATGARSNASLSSNVLTTTNQSVAVTLPSVDVNGQDYWEIDVTKNGEGAVGNHFFLQEIPETVVAETITEDATLDADTTINLPNDTLTSAHIGWLYRGYQVETNTVVAASGITTSGNARSVVTAAGMSNSPKTVTVPVTTAAHTTAALIAAAFRTALAADPDVGAFFTVGGSGADITLTARTVAADDATMNFTIEDVTSVGISDDTTSVNTATGGDTETYITAVGADDSGGAGFQQITLAAASTLTTTQPATFIRGVNGVARTIVIEWRDADIVGSDLAPIRDYPPPAGIFGGVLGDVVFVDGALGDTVNVTQYAIDNSISRANTTTTYRGNAIAVSDPARPESFPPDNYVFTNDPPTALLPGTHGIYWRFSRNSLGVVRYVGGSPAIRYERLWTGIGIANQKLCTLGSGGRLYAFTGGSGLVRLGVNGEPETLFASAVHGLLTNVTWLGYDPSGQYVLVGTTTNIYAFHEPSEKWCAPLRMTHTGAGTVPEWLHCVSHNGIALISGDDVDTSSYKMYRFNGGAGLNLTVLPTLVTPWVRSDGSFDILERMYIAINTGSGGGSANLSASIQCNAGAFFGYSATVDVGDGLQNVTLIRPNVSNARSWQVRLSHQTATYEEVVVEGETSQIGF